MIWDVEFGDGTVIRAKHESFRCASIIAQCQRIQFGETHEMQLAVLGGVPRRGAEGAERAEGRGRKTEDGMICIGKRNHEERG